jgi:hypothetical protein
MHAHQFHFLTASHKFIDDLSPLISMLLPHELEGFTSCLTSTTDYLKAITKAGLPPTPAPLAPQLAQPYLHPPNAPPRHASLDAPKQYA